MMMRSALVLVLLAFSVAPARAQRPAVEVDLDDFVIVPPTFTDSLDARRAAERGLKDYYLNPFFRFGQVSPTGTRMTCDADEGEECTWGDPGLLYCLHGLPCRPREDGAAVFGRLVVLLEAAARGYPGDGFLVGQAVWAAIKAGRYPQALEMSQACAAERWWCDTLLALVHYRFGNRGDAQPLFGRAYDTMPDELRCAWADIGPLLEGDARGDYEDLSCDERRSIEARAWWLADPVWLDEGNDRLTAHLARRTEIRLHEEIWAFGPEPVIAYFPQGASRMYYYEPHLDWREYPTVDGHITHHEIDRALGGHHRGIVAIGWADSWYHDGNSPKIAGRYQHWRQWVSDRGARYRFFPTADILEDPMSARSDSWSFEDGDGWERYTPAYGRFTNEVPYQLALFRRGDSMEVALATDLEGVRGFGGQTGAAGVVVQADHDEEPLALLAQDPRDRYVFRGLTEDRDAVMSLELFTTDTIGRVRTGVRRPWAEDGRVSVSDVLVFQPVGAGLPEDLGAATAMMRGSDGWTSDEELGLYWETYGLEPGEEVEVALRVFEIEGGLFGRLGRALGIGDTGDQATRFTRVGGGTDEAPLEVDPATLSLDLRNLGTGVRQIELTVTVEGETPVVRTARIEIEPLNPP